MVQALRAGAYVVDEPVAFARVGIGGHSMGAAVATHEAGAYGDVDALLQMGFTQLARPPLSPEETLDIALQATTQEYVTQPSEQRVRLFYNASFVDPGIPELDNALSHPGPSGQFLTTIVANPNEDKTLHVVPHDWLAARPHAMPAC